MLPPWKKYPDIPWGSIGWRMGYGEDYWVDFCEYFETLSADQRAGLRDLHPEPEAWRGFYDMLDGHDIIPPFWEDDQPPERPDNIFTGDTATARAVSLWSGRMVLAVCVIVMTWVAFSFGPLVDQPVIIRVLGAVVIGIVGGWILKQVLRILSFSA